MALTTRHKLIKSLQMAFPRGTPFDKTHHDQTLRSLAKKFLDFSKFPELIDSQKFPELAQAQTGQLDGCWKHVAKFPKGLIFGVRFFIAGRTRFLAYVHPAQLVDAFRFADACTLRFWKYRQRSPEVIDSQQFNFSRDTAQADLDNWKELRPEIVELIDSIESHFLDVEVFVDPANRREVEMETDVHNSVSRRTIRGELRSMAAVIRKDIADNHQFTVDLFAAMCERLDALDEK